MLIEEDYKQYTFKEEMSIVEEITDEILVGQEDDGVKKVKKVKKVKNPKNPKKPEVKVEPNATERTYTAKLKALDEFFDTAAKPLQRIFSDEDFYYFRNSYVAFKLKKSKYSYLDSYIFADEEEGAEEDIEDLLAEGRLPEDLHITEEDIEDLHIADDKETESFFECNETVEEEDTGIESDYIGGSLSPDNDSQKNEVSDVNEESYETPDEDICDSKNSQYDYLAEFKEKINAHIRGDFYYVTKLSEIIAKLKEKRKLVSRVEWKTEVYNNAVRLEVKDVIGVFSRTWETPLLLIQKILGEADVYIQSEREIIYLESKKGSCYLMPSILTVPIDENAPEKGLKTVSKESIIITAEGDTKTCSLQYVHLF